MNRILELIAKKFLQTIFLKFQRPYKTF